MAFEEKRCLRYWFVLGKREAEPALHIRPLELRRRAVRGIAWCHFMLPWRYIMTSPTNPLFPLTGLDVLGAFFTPYKRIMRQCSWQHSTAIVWTHAFFIDVLFCPDVSVQTAAVFCRLLLCLTVLPSCEK